MTDAPTGTPTYAVILGNTTVLPRRTAMKRFAFTLFVAALAAVFGPHSASALQFADAKSQVKTAAAPVPVRGVVGSAMQH